MTDDQEREDFVESDSSAAESDAAADAPGAESTESPSPESQDHSEAEIQEQEPDEHAASEEAAAVESQAGEIAVEAVAAEPATEPEEKAESRFGRFLKRALRWIVFLLVVFAIGVLAMQFLRVQPQQDEIASLSQSLDSAATAQAELESELGRLEGVEAENEELTQSLIVAGARLAILDIRLEVAQAQLALATGDTAGVAAALQGTGEKVMDLRDILGEYKSVETEALRERLVLVLSEVDSDPFAAERDLEILANTLQEIDREISHP